MAAAKMWWARLGGQPAGGPQSACERSCGHRIRGEERLPRVVASVPYSGASVLQLGRVAKTPTGLCCH